MLINAVKPLPYTSIKNAKLILENKNLLFSSPDSFNDPFDMYEGLIDFTPLANQNKTWVNNLPGVKTRKDRKQKQYLYNQNKSGLLDFQRKMIVEMRAMCGVCCFSKRLDQPLLWSHYTQKHTGVCIGFDIHPVRGINFTVQPVKYVDKIIAANYYIEKQNIIPHWSLTKSHIWSYEEEVRAIIINRNNQSLFNFERGCVREIYYGCKTSMEDIALIEEVLNSKNYKLDKRQKMEIDESTFSIKPVAL